MRAQPVGRRYDAGAALLDHCQAGLAVTFIMGGNFLRCAGMKKAQSLARNFGLEGVTEVNRENNIFSKFGLIRQRFMAGYAACLADQNRCFPWLRYPPECGELR